MGATNVPWQLDPAMLRPGRFDEKVYIPLPDPAARRHMLDLYLAKRPVAPDVDLDDLARRLEGYSGADVKYVCDRAATISFLQSVASGQEGQITAQVLDDVSAKRPRRSPGKCSSASSNGQNDPPSNETVKIQSAGAAAWNPRSGGVDSTCPFLQGLKLSHLSHLFPTIVFISLLESLICTIGSFSYSCDTTPACRRVVASTPPH